VNLSKALELDVEKYKKMEKNQNEILDAMFNISNLQKHMKKMDFKSSQMKMEKELLYYSIMKDEEQKHLLERHIEIQNADIKVKKMIKDESTLSTSSQAIDQLTLRVHASCLKAIENAKADKRKTVMDRDFQAPTTLSWFTSRYTIRTDVLSWVAT
jgi:histone H3/H4